MHIPFGRHKGEPVEDLPTDYIRWLLETLTLDEKLTEELENQLRARAGEGIVRVKGYEAAVEIVSDILAPVMTPEMDAILDGLVEETIEALKE